MTNCTGRPVGSLGCQKTFDFTQKTLDWLEYIGVAIPDVDNCGEETGTCTINMDFLVDMLTKLDPDAEDYATIVESVRRVACLSDAEIVCEAISGPDFPESCIPLSAIDYTPMPDDDVNSVSAFIMGTNLRIAIGEPGSETVFGDIPLNTLANALIPFFSTAYNTLNVTQKQAVAKAMFSPVGSLWVDSNGLVGEDDGLRNTAGYTDISAL